MKLYPVIAAIVALLFSVSAFAEIDEAQMAQFESDCMKYASEDGVPQEEMEDYLSQCVQDFIASQSASGNEADSTGNRE